MQHKRLLRWVAPIAATLTLAGMLTLIQTTANAATQNLFQSAVPAVINTADPNAVELGVRFHSTVAGSVTGVRFYKGSKNTGIHTGSLWTTGGTRLAKVTFTNETASGWQSANFATAVAIAANTNYIVSYWDPRGFYSSNDDYFLNHSRVAGSLIAPANSGSAPNGVYHYGTSTFPRDTWHQSNYWVDVTFQPGSTPPPTTVSSTPSASDSSTTTVPSTTVPPTTTTAIPPVTTTTLATTTAPVTTTTPPSGDWPTTSNTGATGTLSPASGDVTLDTPNQVYANVRLNGTITVLACGVTIRNVEVDAAENLSSPVNNTPDLFAIWLKEDPSCSVTLDHVSVITSAGKYATEAVRDAYGGPAIVTSGKFIGQQLGMTVGSGTSMSDTYIELAPTLRGDHNEDILEDGIDGLTLTHNTFLNPNGQTSALSLFTEFGANNNVLVQDNLMAGGGFTCYCGDGATDNNGLNRPSNVDFINNVFWRRYFPSVGQYAPGRAYNPRNGGEWTNNVYMAQDGTLTTELVPQPPLDGQ